MSEKNYDIYIGSEHGHLIASVLDYETGEEVLADLEDAGLSRRAEFGDTFSVPYMPRDSWELASALEDCLDREGR